MKEEEPKFKLTFIGISAITRLLLSSIPLRVTTSPPTTMFITMPSAGNIYHIYLEKKNTKLLLKLKRD